MARKNYSDYLNTTNTSCVALILISMCLILQIAMYIIENQQPQLPACRNNQTCVFASSDNTDQGEFVSQVEETRKIEAIYNVCHRTYVPESVITTRHVDVAIRDGYLLSHSHPSGIMAVVQDMNLYMDMDRTDAWGSFECQEYLQFFGRTAPSKTCGLFNWILEINETLGPMSYISYENRLQLSYSQYSDKETSGEDSDRSLSVKLTTFYACPDPEVLNNDGMPTLRRCSDLNAQSCIPSEYFCDGIINCADFGDGIGGDELHCDKMEIFDNSKSVRDVSSELNLMDVLIRPGEKKSTADRVLWILVFIVAPAVISIFMSISIVFTYYKYRIMLERDRDCRKLRAFLDRTGISPDQLKDIQLTVCPGVKTPKICSHSGVGTANVYPDLGRILFIEEIYDDSVPICNGIHM